MYLADSYHRSATKLMIWLFSLPISPISPISAEERGHKWIERFLLLNELQLEATRL